MYKPSDSYSCVFSIKNIEKCKLFCSTCVHAQSFLTLRDLVDCSRAGSSVHRISQARILEWVAISSSRGSSQPRDRTHISCIGGWFLYHWATKETRLNVLTPGFVCWNLIPDMMVLGGGALGRWLVMSVKPSWIELCPKKRPQRTAFLFLCVRTQQEHCHPSSRRLGHHAPSLPAPWSWTSWAPELWHTNAVVGDFSDGPVA